MRSIYKYSVMSAEHGIIEGPITKLLTAQAQQGDIVVWAEVDTSKPNRKFQIVPVGTGWSLEAANNKESILDTHTYISTVQFANGNLVFHIYGAEIVSNPVKKTEPPKEKVKKVEKAVDNSKNKEATFSGTITMINPDVLRQFLGC